MGNVTGTLVLAAFRHALDGQHADVVPIRDVLVASWSDLDEATRETIEAELELESQLAACERLKAERRGIVPSRRLDDLAAWGPLKALYRRPADAAGTRRFWFTNVDTGEWRSLDVPGPGWLLMESAPPEVPAAGEPAIGKRPTGSGLIGQAGGLPGCRLDNVARRAEMEAAAADSYMARKKRLHDDGECAGIDCPYCDRERAGGSGRFKGRKPDG